ncbi:MAG: hypothetical protein QXP42_05300 [Candidatus Micrarchaeia archaeon]
MQQHIIEPKKKSTQVEEELRKKLFREEVSPDSPPIHAAGIKVHSNQKKKEQEAQEVFRDKQLISFEEKMQKVEGEPQKAKIEGAAVDVKREIVVEEKLPTREFESRQFVVEEKHDVAVEHREKKEGKIEELRRDVEVEPMNVRGHVGVESRKTMPVQEHIKSSHEVVRRQEEHDKLKKPEMKINNLDMQMHKELIERIRRERSRTKRGADKVILSIKIREAIEAYRKQFEDYRGYDKRRVDELYAGGDGKGDDKGGGKKKGGDKKE